MKKNLIKGLLIAGCVVGLAGCSQSDSTVEATYDFPLGNTVGYALSNGYDVSVNRGVYSLQKKMISATGDEDFTINYYVTYSNDSDTCVIYSCGSSDEASELVTNYSSNYDGYSSTVDDTNAIFYTSDSIATFTSSSNDFSSDSIDTALSNKFNAYLQLGNNKEIDVADPSDYLAEYYATEDFQLDEDSANGDIIEFDNSTDAQTFYDAVSSADGGIVYDTDGTTELFSFTSIYVEDNFVYSVTNVSESSFVSE